MQKQKRKLLSQKSRQCLQRRSILHKKKEKDAYKHRHHKMRKVGHCYAIEKIKFMLLIVVELRRHHILTEKQQTLQFLNFEFDSV